jgi:cobyrinic acid a,c-diamide synthase
MAQKDGVFFAFKMKKGDGIMKGMDGLCYRNVLATYTHLHALGANGWVKGIMHIAIANKERNLSFD